jgi:hypothetical protein
MARAKWQDLCTSEVFQAGSSNWGIVVGHHIDQLLFWVVGNVGCKAKEAMANASNRV